MAQGITVAASIFKQAGVPIEDFIALVGTATSITQRSGNEIARGLRTVILNLQGVTDAELDVTKETISKAEEVLNKYGIAVRNSANKLRAPMEVFREISEKFRGELKENEVAQSEIIQRLAGKRQANIFAAVVNNWGMVEKQVGETLNANGSAMKENENVMNSWQAKLNQLSNAVTKFWQTMINSDAVVGFLEFLTKAVNGTSDFIKAIGGIQPILIGITAGVVALTVAFVSLNIAMAGIPLLVGTLATLVASYYTLSTSSSKYTAKTAEQIKVTDEEIKSTKALVEKYEKLTAEYEKNKKEGKEIKEIKTQLNTVTGELNKKFPDLLGNIKSETELYKVQVGVIRDLNEAKRAQLLGDAENYLKFNKAQQADDEKKLVLIEQIEAAFLSDTSSGGATKTKSDKNKQVSEMNKMYRQVTGEWGTAPFAADDLKQSQYMNKLSGIKDQIEKRMSTYRANNLIVKEILGKTNSGTDWTSNAAIVGDNIDKATGLPINKGANEVANGLIVEDSEKDPDGKTPDLYFSNLSSAYVELENAIKDVNKELTVNESLLDKTIDDESKIPILKQKTELLKKEQAAISDLAGKKKESIQGGIAALGQYGVDFGISYDPSANSLVIRNMEAINQIKGKDIETTNKLRKEAEDLLNSTIKLNGENESLGNNWWSVDSKKLSTLKEIEKIQENISNKAFELSLDIYGRSGDRTSFTTSGQQQRLKSLDKNDLKGQQALQAEIAKSSSEAIKQYGADLEALNMITPNTAEKTKLLNDKISELKNKLKDATSAFDDANKKIEDLTETISKEAQRAIESYYNYLKEQTRDRIDDIEKEADKFIEARKIEIDSLKEKIDLLERENDIVEEKIRREEYLADIAKAREKLTNAENEKTARVFKDGKFQYMANPTAVREAKEKLADIEKDYNEWERKTNVQHQKQALQDIITSKENEIKVKATWANVEKEKLDDFLKSLDKATKTSADNQIASFDQLKKKIEELGATASAELPKLLNFTNQASKMGVNVGGGSGSISSGSATTTTTTTASSAANVAILASMGIGSSPSKIRVGMDTGGYTGDGVPDDGALALLHAKERVLSPTQTRAFEDLVYNIIPQMTGINKPNVGGFGGSSSVSSSNVDNSVVVQNLTIKSDNLPDLVRQLKQLVRSK